MSDQTYEDGGQSSYEADVDAGYEGEADDTEGEAGVAGSAAGAEDLGGVSSHEADVDSGYDDPADRPSGEVR